MKTEQKIENKKIINQIHFLDNLKREYIKLDIAQKIYDNETDKKLDQYRQKNNLDFDYIPSTIERIENIGDNKYPLWYQNADDRKREIFNIAIEQLNNLTGIKVPTYKEYSYFTKWLEMPFVK